MRPVFLAACGLASPLGNSLSACLAGLSRAPQRSVVSCGELGDKPVFRLDAPVCADSSQWQQQALAHIRRVADETGLHRWRDAPLFIATSSLNVGALELGAPWQRDSGFAEIEAFGEALDWRGPIFWINTACTSALNAVLSAHALIAGGEHDDAVVLGLELPNHFTTRGFAAMQLLSATAPRPLGIQRDGLVLGEAVAALHLSARPATWQITRGAHVIDGADPTGASVTAITRCWRESLGMQPVDLIKLQASGSPLNDQKEIAALDALDLPVPPPLVSLKHALGHSLGASAAAELALLTACLTADGVPAPDHAPDPLLPHALSPVTIREATSALLSIVGFGGSHAALRIDRAAHVSPATCSNMATPFTYRVMARQIGAIPDNWQDELAALLGNRPRRIGGWVALGLWGALRCLQQADALRPAADLRIRIATLDGPRQAIEKALNESLDSGVPMPFSFLQSQPSQLLARLAAALEWQGDARLVTHRDPARLIRLALIEATGQSGDILMGWLDEATPSQPARSTWLLLRPETAMHENRQSANPDGDLFEARSFWLQGGALAWR